MIREHDTLVLASDLPDIGLKAGDVCTVVLVYRARGCEVEFMTLDGESLAVVSLSMDRPIRNREIAHARQIDQVQR
jgi:hypothetical protein